MTPRKMERKTAINAYVQLIHCWDSKQLDVELHVMVVARTLENVTDMVGECVKSWFTRLDPEREEPTELIISKVQKRDVELDSEDLETLDDPEIRAVLLPKFYKRADGGLERRW